MGITAAGRPGVFAIRDVSTLVSETHEGGHELKRAVSATQLTAMGIGAIIGTGIFVVVGEGAGRAGPAVILSFVLAAVAVGWGGNLNVFLDAAFGVHLPDAIAKSPEDGGVFNLPAVVVVLAITFLLGGCARAPGSTSSWSA